jgi:hypothetical protein
LTLYPNGEELGLDAPIENWSYMPITPVLTRQKWHRSLWSRIWRRGHHIQLTHPIWHPLISTSLAMISNSCQDVNSQTRTPFFRRSATFWWALKKRPWKASFTTGRRDCANVVQPLESTWSKETFCINIIPDNTEGPEILTGRWDILYMIYIFAIIAFDLFGQWNCDTYMNSFSFYLLQHSHFWIGLVSLLINEAEILNSIPFRSNFYIMLILLVRLFCFLIREIETSILAPSLSNFSYDVYDLHIWFSWSYLLIKEIQRDINSFSSSFSLEFTCVDTYYWFILYFWLMTSTHTNQFILVVTFYISCLF